MRGSDSLCVSYTPMTKGEIWVGSSQNVLLCLPPLLSSPLLSTYVRAAPSPPPPPSRPSVISARAFVINIKVPRSRGGARSGRIADSNATVALSGKTGWRKAGVDRVPVYYLAGLQPAARLTSCLFILGTVFFFFLFFLLFFFLCFFSSFFSLSFFFNTTSNKRGMCTMDIHSPGKRTDVSMTAAHFSPFSLDFSLSLFRNVGWFDIFVRCIGNRRLKGLNKGIRMAARRKRRTRFSCRYSRYLPLLESWIFARRIDGILELRRKERNEVLRFQVSSIVFDSIVIVSSFLYIFFANFLSLFVITFKRTWHRVDTRNIITRLFPRYK